MQPTIDRFRYPFLVDFENDAGEVTVRLSYKLADVDQVYITGYDIENGSTRSLKIKTVESGSFFQPAAMFGTTRTAANNLRDPHAFYIQTPASAGTSTNVELGEKRLFMQTQSWLHSSVESIKFAITDWDNNPVTYDSLKLWGHYTKREPVEQTKEPKRPDPASRGVLNTWND